MLATMNFIYPIIQTTFLGDYIIQVFVHFSIGKVKVQKHAWSL